MACETMEWFPAENAGRAWRRSYPHFLMDADGLKAVEPVMERFALQAEEEEMQEVDLEAAKTSTWKEGDEEEEAGAEEEFNDMSGARSSGGYLLDLDAPGAVQEG